MIEEFRKAELKARDLKAIAKRAAGNAAWADATRSFNYPAFAAIAADAMRCAKEARKEVLELTKHMSFVDRMLATHTDDELVKLGFDVTAMREVYAHFLNMPCTHF